MCWLFKGNLRFMFLSISMSLYHRLKGNGATAAKKEGNYFPAHLANWEEGETADPHLTNGQGNNKNIPPFPEQRCRKSIMSKKIWKTLQGLTRHYRRKPLSFSSVPRTKTFQKIWRDKNSASFFAGDQWTSSPPKFLFRSSSSAAAADVQNICFIAFRPRFTFFLSFSPEKDGRQLFSFLISLLFSQNCLTDVAAFFVFFLSQYFYPASNKISHKNSHYTIRE